MVTELENIRIRLTYYLTYTVLAFQIWLKWNWSQTDLIEIHFYCNIGFYYARRLSRNNFQNQVNRLHTMHTVLIMVNAAYLKVITKPFSTLLSFIPLVAVFLSGGLGRHGKPEVQSSNFGLERIFSLRMLHLVEGSSGTNCRWSSSVRNMS